MLFVILTEKTGQIAIPLNILFNEKKGSFQGRVSLYGRVFGLVSCSLDFFLNEDEPESK